MHRPSRLVFFSVVSWFSLFGFVAAGTPYLLYATEFFDPTNLLAKHWTDSTRAARESIIQWADFLAAQGPWAVTDKTFTPTGANPHDFVSFAPYWWPDCSKVGNTTELTPEEIWAQCPYHQEDGHFNPDYRSSRLNNSGHFYAMADAVMYNSLAWSLTGEEKYGKAATDFVYHWFLDPDTYMAPNVNYGQMHRGPTGQKGTQTGVLDIHTITKILSGILILRKSSCSSWTPEIDGQLRTWTNSYIDWLTTSPLALGERRALNNHATYYFNQLAAFQILIDDIDGAKASLQDYFTGIYQRMIDANGEQPEEANRTLPYHYRGYNGIAMAVNARLAEYVGLDEWHAQTAAGGTIQKACDYVVDNLTVPPSEAEYPPTDTHIWIAMVASTLGDPDLKYAKFLKSQNPDYPKQPWFFWEQPLSALDDEDDDAQKVFEL